MHTLRCEVWTGSQPLFILSSCHYFLFLFSHFTFQSFSPVSFIFTQHFFTAAISRDMQKSIFQFIRTDNSETRQKHVSAIKGKFETICSFWPVFSSLYWKLYIRLSLTVDTKQATYRTRSPFMKYTKSKLGQYDLKTWVCWKSICFEIASIHKHVWW